MKQNNLLLLILPAVLIPAAFYALGFPLPAFILYAALTGSLFVMYGFKYFSLGTLIILAVSLFRPDALFLLICLPIVFFLGLGIRRGSSFYTMMLTSTLSCSALAAVYMSGTAKLMGKHPFDYFFTSPIRESFSALNGSAPGLLYGNNFSDEMINSLLLLMELMSPFIIILSSCIITYIIYVLIREIINKYGYPVKAIAFSEIRAYSNIGVFFLVICFFSMVYNTSPVSVNIIAIFAFMFLICGMSIMDYYLKRGKIPGLIRALIFFFIFILSSFMGGIIVTALFVIGLVDSFRPLRR